MKDDDEGVGGYKGYDEGGDKCSGENEMIESKQAAHEGFCFMTDRHW